MRKKARAGGWGWWRSLPAYVHEAGVAKAVSALGEAALAELAVVWFLARVGPLVFREGGQVAVLAQADATLVGALAAVDPGVSDEG